MSTVTKEIAGDYWVQVPASWGTYLRLLKDKGERSNPKYIYCDGRLTIVSPGNSHEETKHRISWLIETLLVELEIPFGASGALTLKHGKPKRKGVESDTSYYLTNVERIRGKKSVKMGIDPAPDLEVEVVVSHPVEDVLEVHASFGVKEVWVVDEPEVNFLSLGEDGQYHGSPTSRCLPFLSSNELTPWVFSEAFTEEVQLRKAFRRWVTETLLPRFRPDDPAKDTST